MSVSAKFAADEVDSEEEAVPKKEPRMKTNKTKKTNYYTDANVKNKNKNKKRKAEQSDKGSKRKR